MSKYNIVPAKDVAEMKTDTVERIMSTIYEAVKNRVMPCMLVTKKDIPADFIDALKEAGYRVEISPWIDDQNQWRVFWDFQDYRTVEKDQEDTYLDRFQV